MHLSVVGAIVDTQRDVAGFHRLPSFLAGIPAVVSFGKDLFSAAVAIEPNKNATVTHFDNIPILRRLVVRGEGRDW